MSPLWFLYSDRELVSVFGTMGESKTGWAGCGFQLDFCVFDEIHPIGLSVNGAQHEHAFD